MKNNNIIIYLSLNIVCSNCLHKFYLSSYQYSSFKSSFQIEVHCPECKTEFTIQNLDK